MPVIRCETCKGTGKTKQKISTGKPLYSTSGISGVFMGYEMIEVIANCPDCGGSGCKWKEEPKGEANIKITIPEEPKKCFYGGNCTYSNKICPYNVADCSYCPEFHPVPKIERV